MPEQVTEKQAEVDTNFYRQVDGLLRADFDDAAIARALEIAPEDLAPRLRDLGYEIVVVTPPAYRRMNYVGVAQAAEAAGESLSELHEGFETLRADTQEA